MQAYEAGLSSKKGELELWKRKWRIFESDYHSNAMQGYNQGMWEDHPCSHELLKILLASLLVSQREETASNKLEELPEGCNGAGKTDWFSPDDMYSYGTHIDLDVEG